MTHGGRSLNRWRRTDWPVDARDVVFLVGLLLLGAGAGLVRIEAGLITVGVVLLGVALWPAARPRGRG